MTEILIIAVVILAILNIYNDWRIREIAKDNIEYNALEAINFKYLSNEIKLCRESHEQNVERIIALNCNQDLLLSHFKLEIETKPSEPEKVIIRKIK
jgi:hypothetical protein